MNNNDHINWAMITKRINFKSFLPIISDRAFFSSESNFTKDWAKEIGYPYPLDSKLNLAQIGQFISTVSDDSFEAKMKFLDFSKGYAMGDVKKQASDQDRTFLDNINVEIRDLTFSDLAARLNYPQLDENVTKNPLKALASLRLPIYVTTSYYDFLERALIKAGQKPQSEICYWRDGLASRIQSVFSIDPEYLPSTEKPLVFHLFGMDKYPQSMVLTEDDHMDFLVGISKNDNAIHQHIKAAFVDCSLLLLGYQLEDWNFKVLFRGLILQQRSSRRMQSIAIQLSPQQLREQDGYSSESVKKYLSRYFKNALFDIYWGNPQAFIKDLMSHYL